LRAHLQRCPCSGAVVAIDRGSPLFFNHPLGTGTSQHPIVSSLCTTEDPAEQKSSLSQTSTHHHVQPAMHSIGVSNQSLVMEGPRAETWKRIREETGEIGKERASPISRQLVPTFFRWAPVTRRTNIRARNAQRSAVKSAKPMDFSPGFHSSCYYFGLCRFPRPDRLNLRRVRHKCKLGPYRARLCRTICANVGNK
jgi:hypothetical protein